MVILAVGMIAGAEETYSVGIYVPQQQCMYAQDKVRTSYIRILLNEHEINVVLLTVYGVGVHMVTVRTVG